MLLVVECHRDDEVVKQGARSLDNVQMPVGHRIKAPWIDRETHGVKVLSLWLGFPLLPFYRARWLTRDIVADSVDSFYFIDNSRRDPRQNFEWDPDPVGGHPVLALHDAQRDTVFVGSLVTHYTDRPHRQQNSKRLPDFVIPIGSLHFIDHNLVCLSKDLQPFFGDLAQYPHGQPGSGEWLSEDNFTGQLKLEPYLSNLIFKELPERLKQFEVHGFRQSAHIVMALDKGGGIAGNRNALDHVWIQSSLSKKPVLAVTGLLGFQFFRRFFENAYKFATDQLSLLLGVSDTVEQGEEALRSVDVLESDSEMSSKDFLNGFGF